MAVRAYLIRLTGMRTTQRVNYVRAPSVWWPTEKGAERRIMGAVRDLWNDTPSRSVIGS